MAAEQPVEPSPVTVSRTEEPVASRTRRIGAVAVRLAFDLLVVDAAAETWLAGSPLRVPAAAVALLYFTLTIYVVSRGGRIGRGWLMDPVVPSVVFLALLVASSWTKDGLVHGVVALRQPTPVVFSGVMSILLALAAIRMVAPGGARSWWIRLSMLAVSAYACASFGHAAAAGTPFIDLLTGHGYWPGAPWWLQGTWIGAFVLLPLAFLRELGTSIVRLAAFPYLRWMFLFGTACWVVFNVVGL